MTSYFISSKSSNERRDVEREIQDKSDETESDSEAERSPVALHEVKIQVQFITCLMHLVDVLNQLKIWHVDDFNFSIFTNR